MSVSNSKEDRIVTTQTAIVNDLIKILYKNIFISVPASFICATIVFLAISYNSDSPYILAWYAGMILVSITRLISYFFYAWTHVDAKVYLAVFLAGVTLNAALWGTIDSLLMPTDLILQMVVIVMIAGITAGGAQTLMGSLVASVINLFVMVIPLCIWINLQHQSTYNLLNVAMVTYMFFMFIASVRNNKILLKTMRLQYENQELVNNLSTSNSKLFQSYKMLEKHENELAQLNKLNILLQSCQVKHQAYSIICEAADELFSGHHIELSVLNEDNNIFELTNDPGENCSPKSKYNFQDCIALRTGKEYHANDMDNEEKCLHIDKSFSSYICLPFYGQYGVIGVFTLYSPNKNALNNYILQLANSFIEVIQLNIINISLRESLYDQTIHDPLTGLYNRRKLETILSDNISKAINSRKKMCVAMLDIDHFKKINDLYGHDAGDEVLRFISKVLSKSFNQADCVFRYGGEEFLIILTDTSRDQAMKRINMIRNELKSSSIYHNELALPKVTISVGLAEVPQDGKNIKSILHAADHSLYRAKELGRDRIICFSDEMNDDIKSTE